MTATTCTITVGIAAGAFVRCGKPAVVTVPGHPELAECEGHAPTFALREAAPAREVEVGAPVRVTHGGIVKVGRVVHVGRTRVRVEVPVVRTGGVKVIERAMTEVEVTR